MIVVAWVSGYFYVKKVAKDLREEEAAYKRSIQKKYAEEVGRRSMQKTLEEEIRKKADRKRYEEIRRKNSKKK